MSQFNSTEEPSNEVVTNFNAPVVTIDTAADKKSNGKKIVIVIAVVLVVLVGVMLALAPKGWAEKDGHRVYYNWPGRLVTASWMEENGNYYYLDENGYMLTGLQKLDNEIYFFDEHGVRTSGWQTVENDTYYFLSDGIAAKGWNEIDGSKYNFGYTGIMVTGWLKESVNTYYLDETGAMVTGWLYQLGEKYYFDEDGAMKVGIHTIDTETYCFAEDGKLLVDQDYRSGNHLYVIDKIGKVEYSLRIIGNSKLGLKKETEKASVMIDGETEEAPAFALETKLDNCKRITISLSDGFYGKPASGNWHIFIRVLHGDSSEWQRLGIIGVKDTDKDKQIDKVFTLENAQCVDAIALYYAGRSYFVYYGIGISEAGVLDNA